MEKKKVISLRFTKEQHAQLKKEAGMISLHRYIIHVLFEQERPHVFQNLEAKEKIIVI